MRFYYWRVNTIKANIILFTAADGPITKVSPSGHSRSANISLPPCFFPCMMNLTWVYLGHLIACSKYSRFLLLMVLKILYCLPILSRVFLLVIMLLRHKLEWKIRNNEVFSFGDTTNVSLAKKGFNFHKLWSCYFHCCFYYINIYMTSLSIEALRSVGYSWGLEALAYYIFFRLIFWS